MNRHLLNAKRRTKSLSPRVESLELRHMPACVLAAGAGLLTITCGPADDTVSLNDPAIFGGVTGMATGVGAFGPIWGINTIVVDSGAGNDFVVYSLNADLLAGVTRKVTVKMQDGNDELRAFANADVDIAAGARLELNGYGGNGNDFMGMRYQGELDGEIRYTADGQAGHDTLVAYQRPDCGSTGMIFARAYGSAGDDQLTMEIRKQCLADPVVVDALIDGGLGFDTAWHTANVGVVGIQIDNLVV